MSKKVTYAKLHDGFFIPSNTGAGKNIKDTLPPDNLTLSDLAMTLEDNGSLMLSWSDIIRGKRVRRSCVVGAANVKNAILEDEEIKVESGPV